MRAGLFDMTVRGSRFRNHENCGGCEISLNGSNQARVQGLFKLLMADRIVPIFKYFVFVGLSLLGLIVGVEALMTAQPMSQSAAFSSSASVSLDVLKEMAHHGDNSRPTMAAAGPLLPMTVTAAVAERMPVATTDPAPVVPAVATPSPSVLNAQAQVSQDEMVKPTKLAKKKIASRKPTKTHTVYVENTQRGPFGFGAIQSW